MPNTSKPRHHKGWKAIALASVLLAVNSMPLYSATAAAQDDTARAASPYPHRDIRSVRPALAEQGIKRASQGRIVITIWGSTDRVRAELHQAADELHAEGVPVSLYFAGAVRGYTNVGWLTIHSNGEQLGSDFIYPKTYGIRENVKKTARRYAATLR